MAQLRCMELPKLDESFFLGREASQIPEKFYLIQFIFQKKIVKTETMSIHITANFVKFNF